MATLALQKLTYNTLVEIGTDEQGNIKTAKVGMGNMSESGQNDDKLLAVVQALSPCLANTISSVEKTEVSTVTP